MDISHNSMDSQLRITISKGDEVIGYLVIDSIVGGHSYGGIRIMPDIDEKEISILARAMTLKFGFLGLPHGGAKAGVVANPEGPHEERLERLKAFGQAIAPLLVNRVFIPATDMGTEMNDIRYMVKSAGIPLRRRDFSVERSGYYTALTVFTALKQATRYLGLCIDKSTIAIEGFGKVGAALAGLLSDANACVVAISTSRGAIYNPRGLDIMRLNQLAAEEGSRVVDIYTDAERINRESLLELPVDILCPCARHNSIHTGNSNRISARVICPGANNPVTEEAERVLFEKGIISLPYFVTNCGGVLGGTMEFASMKKKKIEEFIDLAIGSRMASLLDEAARSNVPPTEIAMPLALRRFEEMRLKAAHPTPQARIFGFALNLYRMGLIPGAAVGTLAPRYFKRIIA
jgi:glutamate dehydrogenase (NAD(P)+)